MPEIRGSARIAFSTSMPEMPGIITSSSTRSICFAASIESAALPFSAQTTS
jgi:hypothetical protein